MCLSLPVNGTKGGKMGNLNEEGETGNFNEAGKIERLNEATSSAEMKVFN